MKKKAHLNIYIILFTIIIITITTVALYINSIKSDKIPNLLGTYQSEQKIELKGNNSADVGYLQLAFLLDEGKVYKLCNNDYIGDGTYIKDNNIDNAYKVTINFQPLIQ